ncbi:MAG TPA: carboxypeptidase-like regulatory domain-containing protein [Flavobacteriaceae bacterium]|nr:carboxypeptidase-like regulatory domain-containing protein [Flavobacteriaceae bacterium]
MKFKPFFLFFQLCLFLWATPLLAGEKDVFLKVTETILEAGNGTLVGTSLKLVNLSEQEFRGKLVLTSDNMLGLVGKPQEAVIIPANDSLFVSIKALVSQIAKAGEAYRINARLYDSKGTLLSLEAISVTITETQSVTLYVRDQQIAMEKRGGVFEIDVQLYNAGNIEQEIVLLTKLPHEIQGGFQRKKLFMLRAFQDTTVRVSIKTTRQMLAFDDFSVHITGLYKKGEVFGRETVQVTAIKTSRKYRPPGTGLFPIQENQFFFRAQNPGETNSVYEVMLNTKMELPDSSVVRLNLNGAYRKNIDELYFRNTWVGYESERFGGKIGNLYQNYDITLYGRGAEFYWNSKDKRSRFEIGALENSYRLFDSWPYSQGKSVWGGYRFEVKDRFFYSTFIYDQDPLQNYRNMLLSTKSSLVTKENLKISGGISGGRTSTYNGNEDEKYGVAGEFRLTAQVGNFSFSSDNYVSTGYYPGRKRGALNFNERINLTLEKYAFWANFNHYGYRPKYVSTLQGSENNFSLTRAEAGVSRKLGTYFISFGPQYSVEERTLIYTDQILVAKLSAFRLNGGVSYAHPIRGLSFNFDIETGVSQTQESDNNFQFRSNFNFGWGIFRLHAAYQWGSFYLGEAISNQETEEAYYRWQISPNIHYEFFNDKLELSAGTTYSYNTNSEGNLQLFGRANYEIVHGLEFFMGTEYYKHSFSDYSDRRIEFGIIKNFAIPDLGIDSHELEIFVYKEIDGKEGFSGMDEIAVEQVVYINGKAFKTDAKGKVLYRKIPAETYSIQFDNLSNWYAKDREVKVSGDTYVEVGLEKMTTIKGSISYSSTILSYEINKKMGGLNVRAVDAFGKTYSTRTADDGTFVLYVPKGTYTLSLIAPGIMQYIDIENNKISVKTESKTVTEVDFKVTVKQKRVEYKKFTSN